MKTNEPVLNSIGSVDGVNYAEAINVSIPCNTNLNEENGFPMHGLPKSLRKLVKQCEDVYDAPKEIFVVSFLVAMGAAMRKKVKLVGKYINYPQLWAIVIADSGSGKTAPLDIAFKPLRENDIKALRLYHTNGYRNKDNGKLVQSLNSDATPEALYELIANGDGITIVRDELAGWFNDFGRYNKSGEVQNYLSIFSNQSFTIARKNDGVLNVNDPYLSIIGTIQPQVLARYLKNDSFIDNGFLQRFVFVYPIEIIKGYYKDIKVDESLLKDYSQLIQRMCEMRKVEMVIPLDAEVLYKDYFNELVDKGRKEKNSFLKTYYDKLQIIVLRIAIIIAVARCMLDNKTLDISKDDMRYSIDVCKYFEHMAERVNEKILQDRFNPISKATKEEVLKEVQKRWHIKSISALADALGISRQAVAKALN